ncbi:glycosyltransferase, GT2 family [Flavobacteriaceae bacterium 3519-10]|nr:glycosyltransferase, GT2 family [Flavobacteriaceae bacterium 3519-10]
MLLSITLATYNVELYLRESLDSIVNQTLPEFELICLDDASSDGTVEILQEYAQRDSRIRLILKKKNEGLAVARNTCLTEAKGKYITFLDGDDFYDPTLFQKAVALAEKDAADLVMWDYVTFWNKADVEALRIKRSDLNAVDPTDKKALLKRPSFIWIKLVRVEKWRQLNIHFPPGYTRQDIPVHWHLITALDKVSLLPERLSFYRQQADATTAKKDGKLFHLVHIMDIVEKYLRENSLYNTYRETFLEQRLNFFAGMYDNIKPELKGEALQLIQDRMSPEIWKFLKSKNNLRLHTRYFFAALLGSFVARAQLALWHLSRTIYRKLKT